MFENKIISGTGKEYPNREFGKVGLGAALSIGKCTLFLIFAIISVLKTGSCSVVPHRDSRTLWKYYIVKPTTYNPCTNSDSVPISYDVDPAIVDFGTKHSNFSGTDNSKTGDPHVTLSSDWKFDTSITNSGLTLGNVMLYPNWTDKKQGHDLQIVDGQPRLLATKMGLDRYSVYLKGFYNRQNQHVNSQNLLGIQRISNLSSFEYRADFKDNSTCTLISQDYIFTPPLGDNEPHRYVHYIPGIYLNPTTAYVSSKWIPSVSYTNFAFNGSTDSDHIYPSSARYNFRFESDQSLDLSCSYDTVPRNKASEFFRDANVGDLPSGVTTGRVVNTFIEAYKKSSELSRKWHVIKNGKDNIEADYYEDKIKPDSYSPFSLPEDHPVFGFAQDHISHMNPDNLHMTYEDAVDLPKGGLANDKDGNLVFNYVPQAGCPECIHIHWRWSDVVSKFTDPGNLFGQGGPMIPVGSRQDVWVSLQGTKFLYTAIGRGTSDQFFGHGGFYSSKGSY